VGVDAGPTTDARALADVQVGRDARADTASTSTPDADAGSAEDAGRPPYPARLRVVTLNTHSFQEGDDSIQKLRVIGDRLGRLGVDIVGLNEVMSGTFWAYDYGGAVYDGTEIIQDALEAASGVPWHAHGQVFAHWADGEAMSNVVLSRFPIQETGHAWLTTTDFWPAPHGRRCAIFARVDVPQLGPVGVFVTHTAGFDSVDTGMQIREVKTFRVDRMSGDEELLLLLGDLNMPSTWPAYETWLDAPPVELVDTYALANPDGFEDPTMVGGDHRIDYILAGAAQLAARPWGVTSMLVFAGDAVDGVPLPVVSDHLGVMTTFEMGE